MIFEYQIELFLVKPKCQNARRQAHRLACRPSGASRSRRINGVVLSRQNTPERTTAVTQLAQEARGLALAMFNSRARGVHHSQSKIHGQLGTLEILQSEQVITEMLLSVLQHIRKAHNTQRQNVLDRASHFFACGPGGWISSRLFTPFVLVHALPSQFLMSCVCLFDPNRNGVLRAPDHRERRAACHSDAIN
jgi:hypothetical protein